MDFINLKKLLPKKLIDCFEKYNFIIRSDYITHKDKNLVHWMSARFLENNVEFDSHSGCIYLNHESCNLLSSLDNEIIFMITMFFDNNLTMEGKKNGLSPNTQKLLSKPLSSYSHHKSEVLFPLSSAPTLFIVWADNERLDNEYEKKYISDCFKYGLISLMYQIRKTNSVDINNAQLPLLTPYIIENFDTPTDYLIEDFVYPEEVTVFYAPPAEFKSIIALYMATCLASGTYFLGRKVKKSPVLYFDKENNMKTLKERQVALRSIDAHYPLYVARDGILIDHNRKVDEVFLEVLEKTIRDKGIKLIIFDTLHRFCFYDENSASDLNMVYSKVFKRLQDLGCAVWFLHHSAKSDKKSMRGSGDILGQVDCAFSILRDGKKGNSFKIENHKRRSGELPVIKGKIDFQQEKWVISQLSKEESFDIEATQSQKTNDSIIRMLDSYSEGLSRRELLRNVINETGSSESTFNRSISALKNKGIIEFKSKKYFLMKKTSKGNGHPSLKYSDIAHSEQNKLEVVQ